MTKLIAHCLGKEEKIIPRLTDGPRLSGTLADMGSPDFMTPPENIVLGFNDVEIVNRRCWWLNKIIYILLYFQRIIMYYSSFFHCFHIY